MSQTISSERSSAVARTPASPTLAERFAATRDEDRAALVAFVTAGHPSAEATGEVLDTIAAAGADVIELGIPFSDPLADGPVIQRSSQIAIDQGVNLAWTLEALASFRARNDTPVVLFGYLNPVLRYGTERFIEDAAAAGAQGVLLTDLPVGVDADLEGLFADSPLDFIRLVSPTTSPERARAIARAARGFLYYVSKTGVTGTGTELTAGLADEVRSLRAAAAVPIAVGFGISTPEQARTVAGIADGVVVGTALVRTLEDDGIVAAARLVEGLRSAMSRG
jgi:tryptophan synthase alpha chain